MESPAAQTTDEQKLSFADQKAELGSQAKYVWEQMKEFESGLKAGTFPEVIYLINSAWFTTWKQRVCYDQFKPKQEQLTSFFGNWNKPTSNLFRGSLGDKLAEEAEFNTASGSE